MCFALLNAYKVPHLYKFLPTRTPCQYAPMDGVMEWWAVCCILHLLVEVTDGKVRVRNLCLSTSHPPLKQTFQNGEPDLEMVCF